MSCNWRIRCLTCHRLNAADTDHHFFSANHREDLMRSLIKHASEIGALSPLLRTEDVHFECDCGTIDIEWFLEHATHELSPIDEYERLGSSEKHSA